MSPSQSEASALRRNIVLQGESEMVRIVFLNSNRAKVMSLEYFYCDRQ